MGRSCIITTSPVNPFWRPFSVSLKIIIINFHGFMLRDPGDASRLAKSILARGGESPTKEAPRQMVRRVCRDLGNKKNIIVINNLRLSTTTPAAWLSTTLRSPAVPRPPWRFSRSLAGTRGGAGCDKDAAVRAGADE
jgi:hypothetical protein